MNMNPYVSQCPNRIPCPYYDYYAYPNINNPVYGCHNTYGTYGTGAVPWTTNPYCGFNNVYRPWGITNNITFPAIYRAGSGGNVVRGGRTNPAIKPLRRY
ncbi:hypothetical protein QJ854_gp674 [Moumouvirus goulette]|uniref:Uncharacterized protein n=1 Tax=Moumouvirus goulette TaxID=1247379 RepID=M1PGI3_9VIRU|nr:hypothetical protein QJ854_gp674 [Moumouvirus goulette]AGF85108.1 hypothetical protein glt_00299 [Moumouvirus goulette]